MPDLHTTPLTASCLKQQELRRTSACQDFSGEALYKGNLGHAILESLHQHEELDIRNVDIGKCRARVIRKSVEDGRPISASVENNLDKYDAEIKDICERYANRLNNYFLSCQVLGTEIPIRAEIELPDGTTETLASHVDLLFYGPSWYNEGDEFALRCWDWKFKAEAPSVPYLRRNLQLATYAYCLMFGEIELVPGMWQPVDFADVPGTPILTWVQMFNFKPYARACKAKNDEGIETEFKRGDDRPLRTILRSVEYQGDWVADFRDLIWERVRMMRAGLHPANPDPIGCQVCDVQSVCPAVGG